MAGRFNAPMDMPLPVASPIALHLPDRQTAPVVLASPHSGQDYPLDFIAAAQLDALALRRSEDSFVDELFGDAPRHGIPLVAATFPRAFCDPNREPWELDPCMFEDSLPPWVNTSSARVVAGLGTIARVVASGDAIYRSKLRFVEAEQRVRTCWEPFHASLRGLLHGTLSQFGTCLLIDCHSMPASGASRPSADIIIGDAHGTTCAPRLVRRLESLLTAMGYRVRRNEPYAGGYITRTYGRPQQRVHAVQIELARSLYMDEARYERGSRFNEVKRDMGRMIAAMAEQAGSLMAA